MKNEWLKKEEKQKLFKKLKGKLQYGQETSSHKYKFAQVYFCSFHDLLENQKKYNKQYIENNKKTKLMPTNFEEKSLAAVDEVCAKLIEHNLFDFNVMSGPTDTITLYMTHPLMGVPNYYKEDIVAKTRLLNTKWDKDIESNLLSELYSMFCSNIKNYMSQYKNFEFEFKLTFNQIDNLFNLGFKIGNIFDNMKEVERGRSNFKPNVKKRWAIFNPKTIKDIFQFNKLSISTGFEYLFTTSDIEFYINENQPEDEIFLGQKVEGSNYTFNPYVMISHMEDKRLAMRYSACFNSEAQHNYKVIKLVK